MGENRIKWTDQQRLAIDDRDRDVLVTASAGTGKTAVLSGRCVGLVSDKSGCPDVRNMLILTFTEMAAEQMWSRIAERLGDEFARSRDGNLRRQLVLLQGADISTIHSFCKRLITQYFHELGLDPTFSVIDADEARLLKADVLEKAVDFSWRQGEAEELEQLLRRRDMRTMGGFLTKIVELSSFLDGVVSRQRWCERAVVLAAADPAASDLGARQKGLIAERLRRIVERLRYVHRLYENEAPGGEWGVKFEEDFIEPVVDCLDLLIAGDWNEFKQNIRGFQRPRFNKPKELPKSLAELMHESVTKAFEAFGKLSSLAVLNPDYVEKVGRPVSTQTHVLIDLVQAFDRLYSQAKLALNCLDFADLEHYALRLLSDEGADGELTASATASVLREKYKYIFVDEYQDINPVQQAILDALGSGDNLFVVGDVKQSIYAWRGAEPRILIERLKAGSEAAKGLRVDLNANFRSAGGILTFVNKLFSRIMTASFADIDYDESAELRPGAADESEAEEAVEDKPLVEFHILDEKAKDDADSDEEPGEADGDREPDIVTSRRRQAAMIARRIREMVGAETGRAEFQIYDKEQKCLRDVDYSDIVILMRSLAKRANDYVEVLRLGGVPVSCEATAGYFEATEITDMLCLLKILDNPQRDIELAAVLRSPFFGVTDTELAKVRMHAGSEHKPMGFYGRVLEYSESGAEAELAAKLTEILAQIDQWRTAGRRGSIADMIWRIYRSTSYLSFVSALPSGQARRANLLKLHDRAIQFEGFIAAAGIPSLRRFVEFIEKLQETGQDWAPAEPTASAGNAVRILSVHKSKGLEFPVVFLAELQGRFNTREVSADCLANAEDTLGLQIIDAASNSRLSSLAHETIAEQKRAVSLAEEMRILYVAATRAKSRLILTAAQKLRTCARIATNGFYLQGRPVPDWLLAGCKNHLEWILQAFSDQKPLHEVFETGLADQCRDDSLFTFNFHNQQELRELSEFVTNLKKAKSRLHDRPHRLEKMQGTKNDRRRTTDDGKDKSKREIINIEDSGPLGNQLSIVNKSFAWRYGFGEAPLLPAKTSVSELSHRSDEYAISDYSKALDRRAACLATGGGPIDPRLIGSATHLLIASLDLAGPITKGTIEKTKERLVAHNAISPGAAEQINTDSILTFFQTDLGRLALDPANKVHQEWPFTFALPASEWHRASDGRQRTGDRRQKTEDRRQKTEDRRQETGDRGRRTSPGDRKGRGQKSDDIRHPRYAIRDTIIVQGIIDLLIQTPEQLVVIDFKTDKVSAAQAADRAKLYRGQLETYAKAAVKILNAKSAAKHLYFLTARLAIDL